jgi:hypothetical protein
LERRSKDVDRPQPLNALPSHFFGVFAASTQTEPVGATANAMPVKKLLGEAIAIRHTHNDRIPAKFGEAESY